MEDLFGLLVFLAFAAFSVIGKLARSQQGRGEAEQPKWPGPVATPIPRSQPQQPKAKPVPPPSWSKPAEQARAQQPEPRLPGAGGEGVSVESSQPTLHQWGAHQEKTAAPEGGGDLRAVLSNRDAVAQAIVLSEILGKPKALRGRTRR